MITQKNDLKTKAGKSALICKFLTVIAVGVLILSILGSVVPLRNEAQIYDSVLRLHILANSDSVDDQRLKLLVRDRIIQVVTPLVKDCTSLEQVRKIMSNSVDTLHEAALDTVRKENYDYDVTVTIGNEEYPRKSYEAVCFPAGEYLSLQICIGEAKGQNWWCVLFPPLCLSVATDKSKAKKDAEDAFISVGLTEDQYKIVTESNSGKYKARFKILEIIEQLFGKRN